MSIGQLVIRFIFVTIISLAIAGKTFFTYDQEIGTESEETEERKYSPLISGSILPLLLLIFIMMGIIGYGVKRTFEVALSICFGIFLHISLYYLLLIPMLPFLRKHITARACALLWMIPNYLYLTLQGSMVITEPLLVLRAPGKLVWTLFYIWLAGFVFVMVRQIVTHLAFRSQLLKYTEPITDSTILELWKSELERVGIYSKRMKLVVSPETATPLSIGLFRFTTKVVLPKQNYDVEELTLILRHELVHITREDAWSKFFLIFCTAMCWFNPLMWISMRKCADDLELSCDETVLLRADETTRRKYASLILNTAGDERGFTTCLSASATALRYRLGNIMKPTKKASGAVVVALVIFVLFMSCGYVALAYDSTTGAEVIYQSRDTADYAFTEFAYSGDTDYTELVCTDSAALHKYISELTLETITGNFYGESEGQLLYITYQTPDEPWVRIILSDSFLKISGINLKYYETSYYYLSEGVDWEYLDTILAAK